MTGSDFANDQIAQSNSAATDDDFEQVRVWCMTFEFVSGGGEANPAFTLTICLVLAVAIGANTTIFSLVDAVL